MMRGKIDGWNDTIAAIATPPGIGAIAMIRMSGDKALEIADRIFLSKRSYINEANL